MDTGNDNAGMNEVATAGATAIADASGTSPENVTVEITQGVADQGLKPFEAERALREIEEAEQIVASAEMEYGLAKDAASEAKKHFDAKVEELRRIIRDHRHESAEPKLPFLTETASGSVVDVNGEMVGTLVKSDRQETPESEDEWREFPIEKLGLSETTVQKMAEKDIQTVGQLADWTKERGEFWYKDIKGFGPKAADKVSDAMDKFWAKRQTLMQAGGLAYTASVVPIVGTTVEDPPAPPSPVPVFKTILLSDDIRDAWSESLLAVAKAGKKPTVEVLVYSDEDNRFPAGEYIVTRIVENVATLLPVHEADMVIPGDGEFVGIAVIDGGDADGRQLYIGKDADAALIELEPESIGQTDRTPHTEDIPEGVEVVTVESLGLTEKDAEKNSYGTLIADAPYAGDEAETPEISNFFDMDGVPHILIRRRVDGTYDLRKLVEPTGAGPTLHDSIKGRLIKVPNDKQEYIAWEIGDVAFVVAPQGDDRVDPDSEDEQGDSQAA